MFAIKIAAVLAALAFTGAAEAHVAIVEGAAQPGATERLTFRIGHGCHDAPTLSLRVEMPRGAAVVRVPAKPGWTAEAVPARGGSPAAVVWRGRLPAHETGSFPVTLRLPRRVGDLAFPAHQTCLGETADWTGPPGSHRPAPVLKISGQVRRAGSLTIGEAIVSPTRGNVPTNAVYLTVYNAGAQPDRLLGASSPGARTVQLHVTETEGGIARMKATAGLALPPQGAAVLAPGGSHIMITGPAKPLRLGQRLPLTLRFQRAGSVRVEALVAEPPLPQGGGEEHRH